MKATAYRFENKDESDKDKPEGKGYFQGVTYLCIEKNVHIQRKSSIFDSHYIWGQPTHCDNSCIDGTTYVQEINEEGQVYVGDFLAAIQ